MRTYNRLKPFFVRGSFTASPSTSTCTRCRNPGGVINVFNLTDGEQTFEFDVPRDAKGIDAPQPLRVIGAEATWHPDRVTLRLTLRR